MPTRDTRETQVPRHSHRNSRSTSTIRTTRQTISNRNPRKFENNPPISTNTLTDRAVTTKSEQQRGPITIHSKPLCNMKISLYICCKSRDTQDRGVTLKTSRSIDDMLRISKRHRCLFQSIWLRERRDS